METQLRRGGARSGERSQAPLRIHLLGRFEVHHGEVPVPPSAWRRRRPADLLKLVALAPGRTLAREQAAAALWPEKDPAAGANNLHRALYDVRRILGGRFVDLGRGVLRMRPDVWVDVDAFERAVEAGGPEGFAQAVALYRGELAPEDPESAWLRARRAALRARFVAAALPLARAAAAEGDAQRAVPLLLRAVEADGTDEEAHALLVRLLAESGRRAEALRQCDAGEVRLRIAGRVPSGELRRLREAVQRGGLGSPGDRARPPLDGARRAARRLLGTTDPPPVRGRGAIVLLLEALVELGSGTVVLLGERGVGKTRLAVEAAGRAQAAGAAVVCGIGGTAPGVPYALFQDALREEARAGGASPDPLAAARLACHAPGAPGGEDVRRAAFEGVERALRELAGRRPLFLLLDDLHLADESSLNLLHLLARRAREQRLIIVATCSEEAVHAGTPIQMALAHLDCGRLARGVRVPRLGLAGTREQVVDLLGRAPAEATVEQIYRVTDGSPMLVEEVVRAQLESPHALVPADPAAAIRGRVARLGSRAEALLSAAAVAGPRFELEPVRAVSGLRADEALEALDACLAARLLDDDGAGYHFHNGLVRDAIVAGLPAARRAALHGALADALEAAAGEPAPELLARHRRRAGQDDRALRHLVTAGHRAAARAGLREALAFFEEAQELAARPGAADGPARLELLDALGHVQLGLGELTGAARAFADAARLADPSGFSPAPALRARAHRLAALALAAGGQLDGARAELEQGLAAAGDADAAEAAALLLVRSRLLWHEGDHEGALAAAERCAAAARAAGDAALLRDASEAAALARAARGEPAPAAAGAVAPAERTESAAEPLDLHLVLWERDLLGDRAASDVDGLAALLRERARAEGPPGRGRLASGRTGEGLAALAAGRHDRAEEALREALASHRAAGSALGEALALERLAALLTATGRLDEALEAVDEGVVVAERASLRRHALTRLHATEARNRLAAGALYAAEDAVREASETAARHGDCVVCDAAFRPEAVRVLLARGRVAEAALEAAQLEDVARQRGGRVLGAIARATRARVLAAEGRAADALEALAGARAALVAAGHDHEAARCARLEVRLRGPGAAIPDEVRALDRLVLVDADA